MPEPLTPQQVAAIDRLVEFLPTFEDPNFVPGTWPERHMTGKDGKKILQSPYPDYHPAVEEFRSAYSALTNGIHPYDALPEDESPDGVQFSVLGTTYPIEYFDTATLDQIRRYLMLLGRGERFCDGHIYGEFVDGKVVRALRRLAKIREEGSG